MVTIKTLAVLAFSTSAFAARQLIRKLGSPKLLLEAPSNSEVDPTFLYPAYNFSVPIDHFHNESKYEPHSDGFFNISYYFDASYYKPGGPVIVLAGGEDSAEDRLPYLQKGILHQLAQVTNGIGVILEHRYYGSSFPVSDLSTENLRFLSTDQALADYVYFAQHIEFPGVSNCSVTAPGTPWIAYGGSYAGAFVAFLRTLYPGVFWGSISSSGVTEAIVDYWQYMQPIINFGPQQCITTAQKLTNVVDNIFLHNQAYNQTLRQAFGLDNLTLNEDFTTVLSTPTNYWQSRNWDPSIDSEVFFQWCDNITAPSTLYSPSVNLTATAKQLLQAGGYSNETKTLLTPLLNWIGYVNFTSVSQCPPGTPQDDCFEYNSPDFYAQDDLSTWGWRSWSYQVCTQWGYFISGSGVPKNELPLISRLQTVPYLSAVCPMAFNITNPPDVQAINKYGGYNIQHSRLAFIGGQADPWRDATPLAEWLWPKSSTADEPSVLVATDDYGAVHHWDENGVFPNETTSDFPPSAVQAAQKTERNTVVRWLGEFKALKRKRGVDSC